MIEIPIINKSKYELPDYATIGSSGVDLVANIDNVVFITPGNRYLIPTGLFVAIPDGYELQIRSRSGLSSKYGIVVVNSPGTIDSDYRGEIKVILTNISCEDYIIKPGDKIAQMVLAKCEKLKWSLTNNLPSTERAAGGFGSTGLK